MIPVVVVAFLIGLIIGLFGGIILMSALVISGENDQPHHPLNPKE